MAGSLTVALSEDALRQVLTSIQDAFSFEQEVPMKKLGPLWIGCKIGGHFTNGQFSFYQPPSGGAASARAEGLDILWDTLRLRLGFNIPEACIGGWCIVPTPFGCAVHLPKKCFFTADPDIKGEINLDHTLRSEVSLGLAPEFKYSVNAEKPGTGEWKLFLRPQQPMDVDLIDIADTVGDILDRFIHSIVDKLLGFLPGWARDVIEAVLGSLVWIIRKLLDVGDNVKEWLSRTLGVTLGLWNWIMQLAADYFAKQKSVHSIANPYTILEEDKNAKLPAVTVPISSINAAVRAMLPKDPLELVITAQIGS